MDDLISRQAAIDVCRNPEDGEDAYACGDDIQERLRSLPSAQQWIPCSERLPEPKINPNTMDFERVLCSTAFGDVRAYGYGRPEGFDNAHFWNGAGIMDTYVKAWMPLPEPYKGDV